jgi:hypothetical protein
MKSLTVRILTTFSLLIQPYFANAHMATKKKGELSLRLREDNDVSFLKILIIRVAGSHPTTKEKFPNKLKGTQRATGKSATGSIIIMPAR